MCGPFLFGYSVLDEEDDKTSNTNGFSQIVWKLSLSAFLSSTAAAGASLGCSYIRFHSICSPESVVFHNLEQSRLLARSFVWLFVVSSNVTLCKQYTFVLSDYCGPAMQACVLSTFTHSGHTHSHVFQRSTKSKKKRLRGRRRISKTGTLLVLLE